MDAIEYYKNLHTSAGLTQNSTFQDDDARKLHNISHGYLTDFAALRESIDGRHESPIFDLALKEYQFALFALSTGQYRHAFIGLRLFFELWLAAVYFSANELDQCLWERGDKDINWQQLINSDNGILSKLFGKAFNEGLVENVAAFRSIAEKVYRECSEYVHGNLHTHEGLPNEIRFIKEPCLEWHEKAKNMHFVILFVFSVRYLQHLSNESRRKLEPIITGELGHIPDLRAQFSVENN